jgi:hypothetical protein
MFNDLPPKGTNAAVDSFGTFGTSRWQLRIERYTEFPRLRKWAAMPAYGVRRGKAALSSGCKTQEQPARLQI